MLLCLTLYFWLVEFLECLSIGPRVHFYPAFLLLESTIFIIKCIEYHVIMFIKCICFFHAKTSALQMSFGISLCSLLQLGDWVYEKMRMARDSSRDETQKLHKKWLKHQAFMAELAQNKEWLAKIEKVSVEGVFSPIFSVFCISSCFHIISVGWSVPSPKQDRQHQHLLLTEDKLIRTPIN